MSSSSSRGTSSGGHLFSLPVLFTLLGVAAFGCTTEIGSPTERDGQLSDQLEGCSKRLFVTFAAYSYLPRPETNGCWSFERTVQNRNFAICRADGHVRRPDGSRWIYDDTSPRHDLTGERNQIADCARGRERGYIFMARRDGAFRRVEHPSAVRHFAQIYSDQGSAGAPRIDDYFDHWATNQRIGQPMINLSDANADQIERAINRLCPHLNAGEYLGIYYFNPNRGLVGERLEALQNALNRCTGEPGSAPGTRSHDPVVPPPEEAEGEDPTPPPSSEEPPPATPPMPLACGGFESACTPGTCCGGLSCGSGGACCRPVRAACSDRSECCPGRGCVDGNCCVKLGDGCSSDDQCCNAPAHQCHTGRCCVRRGQSCGTDEQCCTGSCRSGTCQ